MLFIVSTLISMAVHTSWMYFYCFGS